MSERNHADELVEFAQRWQPYGGGEPAEILLEFGLTEREYFTRLREAIHADPGMDPYARNAINLVATYRLERLSTQGTIA